MNWLRRVMIGRYGNDPLNTTLLFGALLLAIVSRATDQSLLYLLSILPLALCYLRLFSRDIDRRRAENAAFLRRTAPLRSWFSTLRVRLRERGQYCHFACPDCKQRLRVPRGRGKLEIRCPKCGCKFERKS